MEASSAVSGGKQADTQLSGLFLGSGMIAFSSVKHTLYQCSIIYNVTRNAEPELDNQFCGNSLCPCKLVLTDIFELHISYMVQIGV